jgi:DNA replication protein DnaC
MSKANSQTSSNTEVKRSSTYRGDPNCPICGGIGFVRRDLTVDHPDFGKVDICSCRASEVAQSAYQRVYRVSNLGAFKHMTFDTFKIQGRMGLGDEQAASLHVALNQSQTFARSLKGWLILLGGYGCGKTHLAAAVANYVVDMGVPTVFLTVPDLLDWLRYSYGAPDENFETRFEEIRNVGLLVLDDLGSQNGTAWAQEKLYQILNHRYVNHLPLVVTSNQALEEIEGRIQSRLRDPELATPVRITAPDFRDPTSDTSQSRLSSLDLYTRMTFGSFNLRENDKLSADERANLSRSLKTAHEFAEHPRGWLVFSGGYGCGKTHLAAAIGNYSRGLGQAPIFRSVPDLLDHLRSTFSPSSTVTYDEIFEEVRSARLLILDDLDTQNASPWAKEKLYQILNHRYMAELPTVITTASTLEKIDERIRSRMLDTRVCTFWGIMAPAFRVSDEPPKTNSRARGNRP